MPHPCFDMRKMARIPVRLRKLAERILGLLDDPRQASFTTLVENLWEVCDLSVEDNVHFLPIVYKLLYPPSFAEKPKDFLSEDEHGQLARFGVRGYPLIKSLDKLQVFSMFPPGALEDVWPRLWRCIVIQTEYIDDFAEYDTPIDGVWYRHLSVIFNFSLLGVLTEPSPLNHNHPTLEAIISDTPRIRQYITVILARMTQDKDLRVECAPVMRYLLSYFMRAKEKADFDEMMLGAGGTLIDVCYLFLQYLDTALADILSLGDPSWIVQSLIFVLETIVHNDDEVMDLLAPEGLVKCLVSISIALHNLPGVSPADLMFVQLQVSFVIGLALRLRNARPWIREGLRAGVFVSMALSTDEMMKEGHPLFEPFTEVLAAVIQCLTSYSVLASLEKALVVIDNDDSGLSDRLTQSDLGPMWSMLNHLADERLAVKAEYDENYRSVRFCDSIKCNQIYDKTSLRRCAQCMNMYYCSSECQKDDWIPGQHGRACWTLLQKGGTDISSREKSFLRFLLHNDYLLHKHKILTLRADYLSSSSAGEPFYTEFNYTTGIVRIQVLPAALLAQRFPRDVAGLDYQLCRMGADPGKVCLDVAVVVQGRRNDARFRMFPMRSTSSKVFDGLLDLARDKAAEHITPEQYEASVQRLAEDGEDLVEIH
ncbi:hypothetical protein C8R47DRAFT_1288525 [Mycena vitilis]|nr:hypothetical protein C8R47DRAFT_1288525 [Mycena vitilis]